MLGDRLSERFRTNLTLTFAVASMAMGVSMIVKMNRLPPVIIAVIFGAIAGEILSLEQRINGAAAKTRGFVEKLFPARGVGAVSHEEFLAQFVALAVLFCASGTGIFGAMNEGITGDPSLLLAKSVLDVFTAAIFAARLGLSVAAIAIPQLLILAALFFLGGARHADLEAVGERRLSVVARARSRRRARTSRCCRSSPVPSLPAR